MPYARKIVSPVSSAALLLGGAYLLSCPINALLSLSRLHRPNAQSPERLNARTFCARLIQYETYSALTWLYPPRLFWLHLLPPHRPLSSDAYQSWSVPLAGSPALSLCSSSVETSKVVSNLC